MNMDRIIRTATLDKCLRIFHKLLFLKFIANQLI